MIYVVRNQGMVGLRGIAGLFEGAMQVGTPMFVRCCVFRGTMRFAPMFNRIDMRVVPGVSGQKERRETIVFFLTCPLVVTSLKTCMCTGLPVMYPRKYSSSPRICSDIGSNGDPM